MIFILTYQFYSIILLSVCVKLSLLLIFCCYYMLFYNFYYCYYFLIVGLFYIQTNPTLLKLLLFPLSVEIMFFLDLVKLDLMLNHRRDINMIIITNLWLLFIWGYKPLISLLLCCALLIQLNKSYFFQWNLNVFFRKFRRNIKFNLVEKGMIIRNIMFHNFKTFKLQPEFIPL